ncbi:MAG: hypothetical protein V3U76_00215 [Granulosicoccus sp.]
MMNALFSVIFLSFLAGVLNAECLIGEPIQTSFDSGAAWSMCASVNVDHALQLNDIHYRAPGDTSRSVLQSLHLAQLLVHHHDQSDADAQINPLAGAALGGSQLISLNAKNCDGDVVALIDNKHLCARKRATGILAKYSQRQALQGSEWQLYTVSRQQSLVFQIRVSFAEDGSITPAVSLSGHNDRNSPGATLLSTWRLAFALDSPASDQVEEYNFILMPELGNRRPLQVTPLLTETLRKVNSEQFRGWRVVDGSGAGYYLDPQNSGFAYTSKTMNWALFDIAITQGKPCEQHANFNRQAYDSATANCGKNLDDFVNGEALSNHDPIVWHSQTANWSMRQEDKPAISSLDMQFTILPFDWTPTSPFEINDEH